MDRQQLQKIEQACFLASMGVQLSNIVRSNEDADFLDCPPEFIKRYNGIAKTCEELMADIQNYIQAMFNGEGEG